VNRKVSKEEMAARMSQIYSGKVKMKKCPKANSLKRSADPVSPGTVLGCFTLFVDLCRLTLLVIGCYRIVNISFGALCLFAKASSTGGS
jgi:hypothetical protein